jgi:hypothetical protein
MSRAFDVDALMRDVRAAAGLPLGSERRPYLEALRQMEAGNQRAASALLQS